MSNAAILWLLTGVFCAAFAIISMRAKDKAGISFKSYSIGNGDFPFIFLFFTYFATIMGAGNFFGHAGSAYESGLPWLVYIFGEQGAKLLFALVFAGMAGAFTYKTLPEMIDDLVVNDKVTRAIMAVMITILLVAMTGGQSKALGQIFAEFTGMNPNAIMIMFSLVFILFTCFGGIYSVIWNDLMQGILCVVFSAIFYVFTFSKVDFSLAVLGERLTEVGRAELWSFSSVSTGNLINKFLTGLIGILVSQVIWQRCFSSRDSKQAKNSLLLSGTICIIFTSLTALVGLVIVTLNQGLDANTAMSWYMANVLPRGLVFCLYLLVLCAGMSTADSALNSCAIVIVNDIIHPLFPKMDDRKLVASAKIVTVFVGIASCAAGIYSNSIYSLISGSNQLAASAMAPLVCIGLFWKRSKGAHQQGRLNSLVTPWGARASLIAGFAAALFPISKDTATITAVLLGSAALLVVSLVTKDRIREE